LGENGGWRGLWTQMRGLDEVLKNFQVANKINIKMIKKLIIIMEIMIVRALGRCDRDATT